MPKKDNDKWVAYTAQELKALYKIEKKAGRTKLSEKEWTAKFLIKKTNQAAKEHARKKKTDPVPTKAKSSSKAAKAPSSVEKQDEILTTEDGIVITPHDPLKLTAKEEAFCQFYAQTGHIHKSAVSAGYSPTSAHTLGSRVLRRPHIKERLAQLGSDIRAKYGSTLDRVIEELEILSFSNISDLIVVDEDGQAYLDIARASEDQLRAIETVKITSMEPVEVLGEYGEQEREVTKVEVRMHSKLKAIEHLVRMAKLGDLSEVNVNHRGTVKHDVNDIAKSMAFILNKAKHQKEKEKKDVKKPEASV